MDPHEIADEVYEKMDDLAFHPRYLEVIARKLPEAKDIGLIKQKERLDNLLLEKRSEVFGEIEKDPLLKPLYEEGFKKFFRFLLFHQ